MADMVTARELAAMEQRAVAAEAALREALEALSRVEAERDQLREEVMAPCDCPAHLERKRALAAEAELEEYRMRLAGALTAVEGHPVDQSDERMLPYLRTCPTIRSCVEVRARLDAAEAEAKRAREALRLLLTEVEQSGNGDAKDFGWPRALAAARDVLGDGPFNPLGIEIVAVPRAALGRETR